jgi:uncharacterized lipoprotein YbaY
VGRVVIPSSVPRFSGGVLHVQLEDVSYADRAAVVVAAATISGVDHDPARPAGTIVPFSLLPTRDVEPTSDYSARAVLEQAALGDGGTLRIHTDQVYPVLTRGFADDVTMVLDKWTRQDRTR